MGWINLDKAYDKSSPRVGDLQTGEDQRLQRVVFFQCGQVLSALNDFFDYTDAHQLAARGGAEWLPPA